MSARVTLLVSDELHGRLARAIPHGFRKHLLEALLDMVVSAVEKEGQPMIAALITKEFKLVSTREPGPLAVSENGTR